MRAVLILSAALVLAACSGDANKPPGESGFLGMNAAPVKPPESAPPADIARAPARGTVTQ